MFVSKLPYPLRFTAGDFAVRSLEDLAKQMRVSRAFLRLCVLAGCPIENEGTSAAGVLIWLFDHYEKVRGIAGLAALAPVESLPSAVTARLRMANSLVTLLEFARTRATNWRQKRHLRLALEQAGILGDR